MDKFRLYFYKTNSNREIVLDFIRSLSLIEKTKIQNDLDLLKEHGLLLLNTPLVKKLNKIPPIYELRIKTIRSIRLFFYLYKPKTFIILHGFIKKTNKTPEQEFEIAIIRSKKFI